MKSAKHTLIIVIFAFLFAVVHSHLVFSGDLYLLEEVSYEATNPNGSIAVLNGAVLKQGDQYNMKIIR